VILFKTVIENGHDDALPGDPFFPGTLHAHVQTGAPILKRKISSKLYFWETKEYISL
jgi:hypothetical protein